MKKLAYIMIAMLMLATVSARADDVVVEKTDRKSVV